MEVNMDTGSVLGHLGAKALPSTAMALTLILLAACGGPAPTAVVTPPTPTLEAASPPTELPPSPAPMPTPTLSAADLLLDAAREEGQLDVIALPRDWMNYGEIIDTFSRKYGIRVLEIEPNAGSLDELEALREARRTGSQDSPDVIDVGLSFAVQAKDENLIQPYLVSVWQTIPDNMKDAEGYWYGDYFGVIAFEVNADLVADIPSDWSDLLEPGNTVALGGLPLESYMARMGVYAASLANGGSLDDVIPGLRFFQQVNNAGNLSRVAANRDTVASGETPIAIRWDYLALSDRVLEAGEHNITVVIPKTGLLAGLYAQAISAHAPHPNAAKLWMEFLYSDEGQLLWLKGYGHPVRFTEMAARGAIPADLLQLVPPLDAYIGAAFPTSVQLNQADKAVLAAWTTYVR
jgi:putative spermidine/putrescine transport system substrate-binding protein